MPNMGYYGVQDHSRSWRSVPIESPCDFLSVTGILSRTVSELSQLIVQISDTLRFRATLWGLRTTYDVYLGLIGKRVVDFLLVLIKLFPLGATAESLQAKIDRKSAISLQRGHADPKFQVQKVVPHKSFLHG